MSAQLSSLLALRPSGSAARIIARASRSARAERAAQRWRLRGSELDTRHSQHDGQRTSPRALATPPNGPSVRRHARAAVRAPCRLRVLLPAHLLRMFAEGLALHVDAVLADETHAALAARHPALAGALAVALRVRVELLLAARHAAHGTRCARARFACEQTRRQALAACGEESGSRTRPSMLLRPGDTPCALVRASCASRLIHAPHLARRVSYQRWLGHAPSCCLEIGTAMALARSGCSRVGYPDSWGARWRAWVEHGRPWVRCRGMREVTTSVVPFRQRCCRPRQAPVARSVGGRRPSHFPGPPPGRVRT